MRYFIEKFKNRPALGATPPDPYQPLPPIEKSWLRHWMVLPEPFQGIECGQTS